MRICAMETVSAMLCYYGAVLTDVQFTDRLAGDFDVLVEQVL